MTRWVRWNVKCFLSFPTLDVQFNMSFCKKERKTTNNWLTYKDLLFWQWMTKHTRTLFKSTDTKGFTVSPVPSPSNVQLARIENVMKSVQFFIIAYKTLFFKSLKKLMKDSKRKKQRCSDYLVCLENCQRALCRSAEVYRIIFFDKSGQSDKMNVKNYQL